MLPVVASASGQTAGLIGKVRHGSPRALTLPGVRHRHRPHATSAHSQGQDADGTDSQLGAFPGEDAPGTGASERLGRAGRAHVVLDSSSAGPCLHHTARRPCNPITLARRIAALSVAVAACGPAGASEAAGRFRDEVGAGSRGVLRLFPAGRVNTAWSAASRSVSIAWHLRLAHITCITLMSCVLKS